MRVLTRLQDKMTMVGNLKPIGAYLSEFGSRKIYDRVSLFPPEVDDHRLYAICSVSRFRKYAIRFVS